MGCFEKESMNAGNNGDATHGVKKIGSDAPNTIPVVEERVDSRDSEAQQMPSSTPATGDGNLSEFCERSDARPGQQAPWIWLLVVLLLLIFLLFLPLLLSVAEGELFGTRKVEEVFERVGLHDELDEIYRRVHDFLQQISGKGPW
jgi:hypothetical protein